MLFNAIIRACNLFMYPCCYMLSLIHSSINFDTFHTGNLGHDQGFVELDWKATYFFTLLMYACIYWVFHKI